MPPTRLTDSEIASLHQRAVDGESVTQLAKEVGLATSNLSRLLLRRFGFEPPRLHRSTLLSIDRESAQYIAGLIDGEGTIHLRRAHKTYPYVTVSMSDREPLDFLHSFGGRMYTWQPNNAASGRKRKLMHRWHLFAGSEVTQFLTTIQPFLKVPSKKEKTRQALEIFASAPATAKAAWRQKIA